MANGVDPDEMSQFCRVSSGSTLFAQACLSEYYGIYGNIWDGIFNSGVYCIFPKYLDR